MGSKHAGVHLRCDDSIEVIAKLKKQFEKKPHGPNPKGRIMMSILRSFAEKNISEIDDPDEKAAKQADLANFMSGAESQMSSKAKATIVVREHFVSIYQYDEIRAENLYENAAKYCHLFGRPALGVAVFDDTNFTICAIRDAGTPKARGCRGEYMFDYDDIQSASADEICEIIDAPFLKQKLSDVLSCDDGEIMAETFEEKSGLHIYADAQICADEGMTRLYEWAGATVYASMNNNQ